MIELFKLLRQISPCTLAGLFTAAYVGGFLLGSLLLRAILKSIKPNKTIKWWIELRDHGTWIGLCEHFLVVSFVLADEYTAIALVFAAKELVRSEEVKKDPGYYLVGTLLNISISLLVGIALKITLLSLAT